MKLGILHKLTLIGITGLMALSLSGCSAEAIKVLNSALQPQPASKQTLVTQKAPLAKPQPSSQAGQPASISADDDWECAHRSAPSGGKIIDTGDFPTVTSPDAKAGIIDTGDCPSVKASAPCRLQPPAKQILDTDSSI